MNETSTINKEKIINLPEGTIIEKAYEIDLEQIDEGFLFDTVICHAENSNKAKVKLLEKIKYDNWRLKYTHEDLSYLNIPVKRKKSSDKVVFEGEEIRRWKIDDILNKRERYSKLDSILNNPDVQYCYIWKGEYYRPNYKGYTYHQWEAGVYPKKDAVKHAKSVNEIRLICVNVTEHNKLIRHKISQLEENLIKN
jgi:hypothetical protein